MSNDPNDSTKPPGRMYDDLASWWRLLTPPQEYEEEAGFYRRVFLEACELEPHTLLDLGSGGGNNASYLKARFEMTLVDLSPPMIEQSRALNPECEHILGDMRSVRLGRQFDCVFVHDAVCYITSERDLRLAMETAFVHCKPGGGVLFAPDYTRENFQPATDHGGTDEAITSEEREDERITAEKIRGMRYLEWCWDPDPSDTTYTVDYGFLLRESDGSMRVEHDRHIEGLFSRHDWLRFLSEAGFQAEAVSFEHTGAESGLGSEGFVGRKPRNAE